MFLIFIKRTSKLFNLLSKLQKSPNILITEPLGYFDFFKIFSNSFCVLTDSGGIQEEASILKIPCLTLRNNTERPETLEYGTNVLVGMNINKLKLELKKIKADSTYLRGKSSQNPFGDGKASKRITNLIKDLYGQKTLNIEHSKLWDGIPSRTYKKIGSQDVQKTVNNYEIEKNVRIQLIFDKRGNQHFPNENRILEEDDIIIINFFEK